MWKRTKTATASKRLLCSAGKAIKKAVNVPVIGVGGITEAEFADKLVSEGKVDLVAVGRAFWSDSQWAEKAIETLKTANSPIQFLIAITKPLCLGTHY